MVWLMMGYLFLIMYRPAEVWPVLDPLRLELCYMLVAGTVWLVASNKRLPINGLVLAVAGMVAAVLVCCLASPWVGDCLDSVAPWFKLQVFFLMLITAVDDERSLKQLIATWLVVMGLYMLHSTWEFHCGRHVSRMGISRMVGVDLTNSDPNSFSAMILLSLVFVPVFWRTCSDRQIRWLLTGFVLLAMLCITLTGSRTAFVILGVFFLATAWNTPWRTRALLALALLAPVGFLALPDDLQARFETIVNPDAGPANARQSTQGRIDGFEIGMRLWGSNLATGIGPGAWLLATGRKIRAHNLPGQLAGEMGTLGVVAFLTLLLAFAITYRHIRRVYREHPEWERDFRYYLTGALGLGTCFLLLFGFAGHNLFRPQWILYSAFLIIIRCQVDQRVNSGPVPVEWDSAAAGPSEAEFEPATMYS